jgi:hypothetical protein
VQVQAVAAAWVHQLCGWQVPPLREVLARCCQLLVTAAVLIVQGRLLLLLRLGHSGGHGDVAAPADRAL